MSDERTRRNAAQAATGMPVDRSRGRVDLGFDGMELEGDVHGLRRGRERMRGFGRASGCSDRTELRCQCWTLGRNPRSRVP